LARTPLQPSEWLSEPGRLAEQLAALPPPRGPSDWPGAVEEGLRWLKTHKKNSQQSLLVLKDRQRHGWADQATMPRWEGPGRLSQNEKGVKQEIVEVGPEDFGAPNFALAPLRCARNMPLAGQPLRFTSALLLRNLKEFQPPQRVRLEANAKTIGAIPVPVAE